MWNFAIITTLLAALLTAYSTEAMSHESPDLKQRITRLEATVEELTLKLSEALEQRNKLRAAMSEVLQAKQNGTKIVAGCDTDDLKKKIAYSSTPSYSLGNWLGEHANKCTLPQLQYIGSYFQSLLTGDSRRILNYEVSIR